MDLEIQRLGSRAAKARKITNYLYNRPLVNAENIVKIAGISYPSAYILIEDPGNLDMLKEITGGLRSREYIFEKYLDLFNKQ